MKNLSAKKDLFDFNYTRKELKNGKLLHLSDAISIDR